LEKLLNIEELKAEWTKDSAIDKRDILTESIKTPSLHAKYMCELADHKTSIVELAASYAAGKKVKIRYYSGEMTKEELDNFGWTQYQGRKLLKAEMESFLEGDKDLQSISRKIEHAKVAIYFLEGVIKAIYNRGYEIKNYIEFKKFEAGF